MKPHFIDWIWHIKGSLALAPAQSSTEAFDRLDPLFRQRGTSFERRGDTLVFRKENQHAQDQMSVFNGGILQVEESAGGPVLHYHLTSRALLFCFLAPLLFLGFAQLTIAVGEMEKASTETADKAEKDPQDPAEKYANVPMNPIDKFLGAPAPENPEEDDADKDKEEDKEPSPTPAYVFAGIFAALYIAGRILEDRLIKMRFKRRLFGS